VKLRTALRLGRVSNLPTVWTNTLAGAVLAGATGFGAEFAVMLVAFSLFYTGGMFLNDAFDAKFDAAQRAERPGRPRRARARARAWIRSARCAGLIIAGRCGRTRSGARSW